MTNLQKTILVVGLALLIVALCYPPYFVYGASEGRTTVVGSGWRFFLHLSKTVSANGVSVHFKVRPDLLIIESLGIVLIGAALLVVTSRGAK